MKTYKFLLKALFYSEYSNKLGILMSKNGSGNQIFGEKKT